MIPSKVEVEAALFRNACWCRGRILEAAFGLLLGASQTEAVQHTKVAPATLAKVGRILRAEFSAKLTDARAIGHTVPVPLSNDERVVVRKAADKSGVSFAQYARRVLLDRAYADTGEKRSVAKASVDWEEAVRLAASKPEPAPKPAAAPAPAVAVKAPASKAPTAVAVPRDPEVLKPARVDRRQMLRDSFKKLSAGR